jgi:hypothetical protein
MSAWGREPITNDSWLVSDWAAGKLTSATGSKRAQSGTRIRSIADVRHPNIQMPVYQERGDVSALWNPLANSTKAHHLFNSRTSALYGLRPSKPLHQVALVKRLTSSLNSTFLAGQPDACRLPSSGRLALEFQSDYPEGEPLPEHELLPCR